MINSYKYNDKTQLTKNIKATELKCHGNNHTHNTLINIDHINNIQNFMNINGLDKVIFSRGYSCDEYNKQIGGAKNSYHVKGSATDQCFYKNGKIVPAKEICCMAQDYGFKGIAYIDKNYVHLDNRPTGIYRGDESRSYNNNVKDFYEYFNISKNNKYTGNYPKLPKRGYFVNGDRGNDVKLLQQLLNYINKSNITVDSIIGPITLNEVKKFQKNNNLKVDGFFGKDSLKKAKEITS